jgi:hypothetical protein
VGGSVGEPRGFDLRVALALSLALLIGLIAFRAARPAQVSTPLDVAMAQAALVSQTGGLTVMTADGGSQDLLMILDGRNEDLLVYRTDSQQGLQLMQRYSVPQVFTDARSRSQGTP